MTAQDVIEAVARRRGIAVTNLLGPRRWSHYVAARTEIAETLHRPPFNYSPRFIGLILHRDRTSIVSLLNGGKRKGRARLEGNA